MWVPPVGRRRAAWARQPASPGSPPSSCSTATASVIASRTQVEALGSHRWIDWRIARPHCTRCVRRFGVHRHADRRACTHGQQRPTRSQRLRPRRKRARPGHLRRGTPWPTVHQGPKARHRAAGGCRSASPIALVVGFRRAPGSHAARHHQNLAVTWRARRAELVARKPLVFAVVGHDIVPAPWRAFPPLSTGEPIASARSL